MNRRYNIGLKNAMKTFLVVSLLLNLMFGLTVLSQCQSVPDYLIEESQQIRPGENVESLHAIFGEPIYDSTGESSSVVNWYEDNFDIEISASEQCHIFTPKARGISNIVIVVITDAEGIIKYFSFRNT